MCTRLFSPADAANNYLKALRDFPTRERPPLFQITFMIISLELNSKRLGGLEPEIRQIARTSGGRGQHKARDSKASGQEAEDSIPLHPMIHASNSIHI